MQRPTMSIDYVHSSTGRMVKARFYSYVATLCRKDGDEVMAVRLDGYSNKEEIYRELEDEYPEWNLKGVLKLYDDDFKA